MFQKVLLIGLILISNQLCADNYDFKPGLWETTTTSKVIEIDAPPEFKRMMQHLSKIPAETKTECITDLIAVFEAEADDSNECKTTTQQVNSNKLTFELLCKGEGGTSKGIGEMNLKGKTFTSSLIMTSVNGPMKVKQKIVANGKYIGACQ